ncbi:GIY-YIG nuclease family protein [Aliikangiella coralliicola]|uniref:GIY-YIG nuclease family protein n=1 Tax=Aliikangiella coralliicola TaxID=2592383 RepID=A0A545UD28_9GAMM|nr:GIY-YIG nuclease family protein [Aliikangiella coralliicola]TQV87361.1 GIY-YIG nuclease family protein [Aliikangiella coralliicola]
MGNFDKEWILFGPQTGYSVIEEPVEGLYLIYCEEPKSIKIGISTNPLSRLSNLNTGSPSQLHLVFYSKLLGKVAEENLHQKLDCHRRSGEWFNWNSEVQGFLQGVMFAVSGTIQVSWPFSGSSEHSMFIDGVDWTHRFLDPDNRWTLEPITGMSGNDAFKLFQSWSKVALARLKEKKN